MMRSRIVCIAVVSLSNAFALWLVPCASAQEPAPPATPQNAAGTAEPQFDRTAEGVRLNFRGAPLETVLDFLSREAGFTIVRETDVKSRVDVVSHRPLNRDEIVDLLNSILNAKGYAAIRNDKILTIVSRDEAKTRNIPVRTATSPQDIPTTDEMVTQIIPVKFVDATKLLENLKLLLPSYSVASANEASNTIILTDTQANVRRIAEIVKALDTSVSGLSKVRVFPLMYADAQETASMLTKIFEDNTSTSSSNNNRRGGGGGEFRFGGAGGGGGPGGIAGAGAPSGESSPAREAVTRVVAVAETRTNSVVVAAAENLMETIASVISKIDMASGGDVQIQLFTLTHASADETATLINGLFEDQNSQTSGNIQTPRFRGPGAFLANPGGGGGGAGQNQTSKVKVNAKADTRTNSVVVSAPAGMLDQIAKIVHELDQNSARNRKVFVYSLKNSDPGTVADIVKGMFQNTQQTTTRTNRNTSTNTGTSRNQQNQGMNSGGNSGLNLNAR